LTGTDEPADTEAFSSQGMIHFAMTEAVPGKLDPGGWADQLYTAAARRDWPSRSARP
jgi:hypothetical protein